MRYLVTSQLIDAPIENYKPKDATLVEKFMGFNLYSCGEDLIINGTYEGENMECAVQIQLPRDVMDQLRILLDDYDLASR